MGRGLTDHPTSNEITAFVSGIGDVPLGPDAHAKIIFYSRGRRGPDNAVLYPFSVEMNINHEYWHLREVDPSAVPARADGRARVDLKFSFGNCLDDQNEIKQPPPYGYVPEIAFRNLSWADHLAYERFPALAGWQKAPSGIWEVLNQVALEIFSGFHVDGVPAVPDQGARYGRDWRGFGWGTVHHAVGTLRMPWRAALDAPFSAASVVDEDLRVNGSERLYVCDMSVMPFSSAANPVRTLVALALRLSSRLA